jgi:hypothetical protein
MNNTPQVQNPFSQEKSKHLAAGAVEIESNRAVAEVQAMIIVAKSRPRDQHASFEAMRGSCTRPDFAAKAFYAYPKGGQSISGPSIRMAEELARNWGNMKYGISELSNRDGESEMEAYAWDLETNVYNSMRFTVKHEIHTRNGIKRLTDPRDIYEIGANQGARRLRARILSVLPPDYVEAAIAQCVQTINGGGGRTLHDRVREMLTRFEPFGITKAHIESRVGPLANILPDQMQELVGIYNSIKDGVSKASDWFGSSAVPAPTNNAIQAINAAATAPAPTNNPESSDFEDEDPI